MHIHVEFRPRRQEDRTIEVPSGATVADLIEAVGESLDIMVAVRGETPIPEDESLQDGETVLLLSAASGG